ncbi:MAG: hypothetical protein HY817_01155 [Candidatus Abawacabacteria bacterium]|nr:hypothetical protein [Candidatus Abawacabacteria bacterium]
MSAPNESFPAKQRNDIPKAFAPLEIAEARNAVGSQRDDLRAALESPEEARGLAMMGQNLQVPAVLDSDAHRKLQAVMLGLASVGLQGCEASMGEIAGYGTLTAVALAGLYAWKGMEWHMLSPTDMKVWVIENVFLRPTRGRVLPATATPNVAPNTPPAQRIQTMLAHISTLNTRITDAIEHVKVFQEGVSYRFRWFQRTVKVGPDDYLNLTNESISRTHQVDINGIQHPLTYTVELPVTDPARAAVAFNINNKADVKKMVTNLLDAVFESVFGALRSSNIPGLPGGQALDYHAVTGALPAIATMINEHPALVALRNATGVNYTVVINTLSEPANLAAKRTEAIMKARQLEVERGETLVATQHAATVLEQAKGEAASMEVRLDALKRVFPGAGTDQLTSMIAANSLLGAGGAASLRDVAAASQAVAFGAAAQRVAQQGVNINMQPGSPPIAPQQPPVSPAPTPPQPPVTPAPPGSTGQTGGGNP